ncbi:MAG: DUF4373 domain-containing protein [Candidatus Margulisbacteria bacterium]|nr:DUF4373 domain-containing protein [Candidatus Margulisiibacteriota bacterium]
MNNSCYFSHDSNAKNDENILEMRADYGWEGYGIYWALIESLRESTDFKLNHGKTKGLAFCHNLPLKLLSTFIKDCIEKYNLFASDGDFYWSESLNRRMEKVDEISLKRSESGSKGAAKRWQKDSKAIAKNSNAMAKNSKVKESKVNKKKSINTLLKKPSGFFGPTPENISQIKNVWNEFARENQLPNISKTTPARVSAIKQRLREKEFDFEEILKKIRGSPFLLGKKNGWKVDFDFVFCSKNNYLKILEGNYDGEFSPTPVAEEWAEFLDQHAEEKC